METRIFRGGISYSVYPAKHNEYMLISNDKIVFGNDSSGTTLNTGITWKKGIDLFNQSTYLLSYQFSIGNIFVTDYKIVDRIQNDTLIIIDNANDAFSYYYAKFK